MRYVLRFLSRDRKIVARHDDGEPDRLLAFPDEDTATAYLCRSGDDPERYETHPLDDQVIRVARASGCECIAFVADASTGSLLRMPLEPSALKAISDELNAIAHGPDAIHSSYPGEIELDAPRLSPVN